MDATIVIPTKNGGELFGKVIAKVMSQKTEFDYEVIVVDSGSKDDTVAVAKKAGAFVKEIAPEEFGHGKTRNLGASLGSGKYICFLTQDAMPYDDKWLDEMLRVMESDEDIAGAFGRHLAYPECNLPDRQMLEGMFNGFESQLVYYLDDSNRVQFEDDVNFQQRYGFFSDNNSCLRRSVWEKIPYEDVDFSEDQIWAKAILRAGYKKAYASKSAVYHSHNYSLEEYGKRYFDDFKAVYKNYKANYCPDKKTFIKRVLGDTKYQCGYIKHQSDLSFFEKLKWYWYSYRRNCIRYKAAHDAVEYFSMSDEQQKKLDERYSQQYVQLRA